MARNKQTLANIDNGSPTAYPNGRIKDNSGAGDGTPVNEFVYGDLHEFHAKLMRLAGLIYNGLPDNETNGYQLIDALIALASKNDYVLNIASGGGKLTVNTKLGILKENESFLCKATVNKGAETVIRGTDNTDRPITLVGTFKTGEYVQLISTPSAVILVRLANAVNLNLMVSELLYLKAATTPQELAGSITTAATTPQGNMLAFANWVNGTPSVASLATAIRNGLYPKEHFAIVAGIGSSPTRNIGWFSGYNINFGTTVQTYPISGDFTEVKRLAKYGNMDELEVTMSNAMTGLNYYVRSFVQTEGTFQNDNDLKPIIFKPISTTKFRIYVEEDPQANNNLKIHMEVVQIL